eukprot:TRINITY_DN124998_c0_g1_i1.p1 TRINITY_DN124998_c0_g1~~TRINITY_DN124998_c0_g1_i1.p1  ORF type:complete len:788 (-),score=167.54 TRINITY_DN124998_c0_g1_i1:171-2534(-)
MSSTPAAAATVQDPYAFQQPSKPGRGWREVPDPPEQQHHQQGGIHHKCNRLLCFGCRPKAAEQNFFARAFSAASKVVVPIVKPPPPNLQGTRQVEVQTPATSSRSVVMSDAPPPKPAEQRPPRNSEPRVRKPPAAQASRPPPRRRSPEAPRQRQRSPTSHREKRRSPTTHRDKKRSPTALRDQRRSQENRQEQRRSPAPEPKRSQDPPAEARRSPAPERKRSPEKAAEFSREVDVSPSPDLPDYYKGDEAGAQAAKADAQKKEEDQAQDCKETPSEAAAAAEPAAAEESKAEAETVTDCKEPSPAVAEQTPADAAKQTSEPRAASPVAVSMRVELRSASASSQSDGESQSEAPEQPPPPQLPSPQQSQVRTEARRHTTTVEALVQAPLPSADELLRQTPRRRRRRRRRSDPDILGAAASSHRRSYRPRESPFDLPEAPVLPAPRHTQQIHLRPRKAVLTRAPRGQSEDSIVESQAVRTARTARTAAAVRTATAVRSAKVRLDKVARQRPATTPTGKWWEQDAMRLNSAAQSTQRQKLLLRAQLQEREAELEALRGLVRQAQTLRQLTAPQAPPVRPPPASFKPRSVGMTAAKMMVKAKTMLNAALAKSKHKKRQLLQQRPPPANPQEDDDDDIVVLDDEAPKAPAAKSARSAAPKAASVGSAPKLNRLWKARSYEAEPPAPSRQPSQASTEKPARKALPKKAPALGKGTGSVPLVVAVDAASSRRVVTTSSAVQQSSKAGARKRTLAEACVASLAPPSAAAKKKRVVLDTDACDVEEVSVIDLRAVG